MQSILNTINLNILKQIIENSYNSIVITDANLNSNGPKFLYVNQAFTKMTGYSFDEIKDKTPRILQGEKSERSVLDELKIKCKNGEFFSGSTINYKKNGEEYNVEWNISPIKDKDGKIVKFISIQKDITKEINYKIALEKKVQKQLEDIRKKDIALLNQSKLAAMGEMLDAIAHQWKQPIGIIKLNIDMLKYDFNEKLVNEEYINNLQKNIFTQIEHTLNTLETFRNFLNPNEEIKKFSIEDVLKSISILIKDEFIKYQISIETTIEEPFEIYGFENEFKHFILNILNNAKDAYNSKKEIEKRIIKIRVYKNNNLKIIEISDFAGGISSDILENIFNSYTTKDKEHGSGLGLYLTKQIVEKHNGNIIAFNHNKNGATFQATFL